MERKKLDLADLLVLNSVTMLSITLIWRTVEKIIEGKISPTTTDGIMLLIFMMIIMFEKITKGEFFWCLNFKEKYLLCFWYTDLKLEWKLKKIKEKDYTAYKWLKCTIKINKEEEAKKWRN